MLLYMLQVGGTSNPEWQTLAWSELQLLQRDPLLNSGEVQVLLALHALEPQQQRSATAGAAEEAPPAGGLVEQQDGLGRPMLYAANSRPAFQLPEAWSSSEATAAAAASQNGRQSATANGDHPGSAAAEQAAGGTEQPAAGTEQPAAGTKQQNGHHHGPSAEQQQHEQDEQQPAVQKEQQRQQQGTTDWLHAAAAALASTGCCQGRLVAAWQLSSLDELFPAGADLAAVHEALQPNTLALQFSDGCYYLCPPPLPHEAAGPGSLQASPLKRTGMASQAAAAAAGEEQLDAAAGEAGMPGATRRFANLLVSKLLRSTPNLQVGACRLGAFDGLVV
jgi:hypothetical protein